MKHTSPIAAFVAVASLALARADGGFLGDGGCSGFQLMGAQGYPSYITATGCNGAGDTTVFIDLNHCLANDGGNLVAQDNGGFGGSCNTIWADDSTLFATCSAPDGTQVPSAGIDINTLVSYYLVDGGPVLECFGETDSLGSPPW